MGKLDERLKALEAAAAQRRAQWGNGEEAMERIMTKLAAISARLQDAGTVIEISAEAMAERTAVIKEYLQKEKAKWQGN